MSRQLPNSDAEKCWFTVAQQRMEELRSGNVQSVPGEEVFAKVRMRLTQ